MKKYSMIIRYSEEDKAFLITVPELPGCMADGQTIEEAVKEADFIIDEWIETAKEFNQEIPPPDLHKSRSGKFLLRMPAWLHESLELEATREGVSLNQHILSLIAYAHGARRSPGFDIKRKASDGKTGKDVKTRKPAKKKIVPKKRVAASRQKTAKPR